MVDLTALKTSVDETQSVIFQDGAAFDFNDVLSLNITRVPGTQIPVSSPPRVPVSILKSSPDAMTVRSQVTIETLIEDLETSVEKLSSDTCEILTVHRAQSKATNVAPASGSSDNT